MRKAVPYTWLAAAAFLMLTVGPSAPAQTGKKKAAPKPAASKTAPAKPKSRTPAKSGAKKSSAKTASSKTSSAKKSSTQAASTRKSTSKRRTPVVSTRRGPSQAKPSPERYTEIQRALQQKGYLNSEPDGKWDADSVDALKRFQRDQNLSPNGKLDSLSLIALGLGPQRGGVHLPGSQEAAPQAQPDAAPPDPSAPAAPEAAPNQ